MRRYRLISRRAKKPKEEVIREIKRDEAYKKVFNRYLGSHFVSVKFTIEEMKKRGESQEREFNISDFTYYSLVFMQKLVNNVLGVSITFSDIINYIAQWLIINNASKTVVDLYKIIDDIMSGKKVKRRYYGYSIMKTVMRLMPVVKYLVPSVKRRRILLTLDSYTVELLSAVKASLNVDYSDALDLIMIFLMNKSGLLESVILSMTLINRHDIGTLIEKSLEYLDVSFLTHYDLDIGFSDFDFGEV